MKHKSKQFLEALFWYEKMLPLQFVITKCAERFGSLPEGLYVVADALNEGVLVANPNNMVAIA